MDKAPLGTIRAIDAFGPGQQHALMEGLFFTVCTRLRWLMRSGARV